MATAVDTSPIDISELSYQADESQAGGQGTVYLLDNPPGGLAFKRYKTADEIEEEGEEVAEANQAALAALIDLPRQLPRGDWDWLAGRTAWPLRQVREDGRLAGFLMRAADPKFRGTTRSGSSKLRNLQYLLARYIPADGNIIPPEGAATRTRLDVVRQFARMTALFHQHALVIGDISMNNLLWAGTGGEPASILLLDCDGIRFLGRNPVMEQAETPDWQDPRKPANGLDLETDRYKLALVIGRVLSRESDIQPAGGPLALPPDLPARMADRVQSLWKQAAAPYGYRPDSSRWLRALTNDAQGRTNDAQGRETGDPWFPATSVDRP